MESNYQRLQNIEEWIHDVLKSDHPDGSAQREVYITLQLDVQKALHGLWMIRENMSEEKKG